MLTWKVHQQSRRRRWYLLLPLLRSLTQAVWLCFSLPTVVLACSCLSCVLFLAIPWYILLLNLTFDNYVLCCNIYFLCGILTTMRLVFSIFYIYTTFHNFLETVWRTTCIQFVHTSFFFWRKVYVVVLGRMCIGMTS